jgi:hypothetical protein
MSDEFPAIAAMLAGFSGVDTIISRRGIGVDMSWLPGGGVHVDAAVDTSDESTTVDSDVDSVDEDSSSDEDNNQPYDAPIAKRTRRVFQRRPMKDSAWWKYFISPAAKAELLTDPDGKVARQFRCYPCPPRCRCGCCGCCCYMSCCYSPLTTHSTCRIQY